MATSLRRAAAHLDRVASGLQPFQQVVWQDSDGCEGMKVYFSLLEVTMVIGCLILFELCIIASANGAGWWTVHVDHGMPRTTMLPPVLLIGAALALALTAAGYITDVPTTLPPWLSPLILVGLTTYAWLHERQRWVTIVWTIITVAVIALKVAS